MNGVLNQRRIRYILLTSLMISSAAAILTSLEETLKLPFITDVVYLIYLPSIMLLVIAFHNQYVRRDLVGIITVIILFLLILFNTIFGSII